jgi:peptide-methionine (R)-S-oxide reductase
MKKNCFFILLLITAQSCSGANLQQNNTVMPDTSINSNPHFSRTDTTKLAVSEAVWKKLLPSDVFYVARGKGTERPWTSKFEDSKEIGTYYCAVCGNALFKSNTKFDSGCGWPSFFEPLTKTSLIYSTDNTLGMKRTEVQCGRCDSHLGHVFEDGPPPTGLRYCINGVVLDFVPKPAEKK